MCQSKAHGGHRCPASLSHEGRVKHNTQRREKYAENKFLVEQSAEHSELMNSLHTALAERKAQLADPNLADSLKDVLAKGTPEEKTAAQGLLQEQALAQHLAYEHKTGRVEALATLYGPLSAFDEEQNASIVDNSIQYRNGTTKRMARNDKDVNQQIPRDKWLAKIDAMQEECTVDGTLTAEQEAALATLRQSEAPDIITFSAYEALGKKFRQAGYGQQQNIKNISVLNNIDEETAAAYFAAYRNQYLESEDKPTVPSHWVRGEYGVGGLLNSRGTAMIPATDADMYATFRLRNDPKAVAEEHRSPQNIASIDLETAGPKGRSGFEPENGHIIEVGIVEYNEKGKEVSRLSQLYRPDDKFLAQHGTGAEEIHQISVKDLDGAPAWNEAESQKVLDSLKGRTVLAQNYDFENKWLSYHTPGFTESNLPVSDTLEMAQSFLDLPNYKLKTICSEVGVAYTNGHRATHDAEVTVKAYFKLRERMAAEWNADPLRAKMPPVTI